MSELGKNIKISIFGTSHGKEIGVNIEGLPAGIKIDLEMLQKFMKRRAPGRDATSTSRKEADEPIFVSGVRDGVTDGFPICAVIQNTNAHSSDYESIKNTPRPAHADFTAHVKYNGEADMRGGGHFSGRLTAPLCIAGYIAKSILEEKGIYIGTHLASVAKVQDAPFPLFPTRELFESLWEKEIPVIDDTAGAEMKKVILCAKDNLDSVGGVIECAIIGLDAGLGGPMFDGLESKISNAIFGIPAVKGIEFGLGFESSRILGSENNDPFIIKNGKVQTETNNCGGILGGISNGMPLTFKVAFKPTPSIAKEQRTVNLENMENTTISIKGRHDPCVVIRALPVVEAAAAIVILDMLKEN